MKPYLFTTTIIAFLCMGCTSKTTIPEKVVPVSDFKLSIDYKNLNSRLSHLDTLVITTDLSISTSERYEKLTITQKDDTFYYTMDIRDRYNPGKVTLETTYSKSYAKWDFGAFLTRHTNRFAPTNDKDYDRMQVTCNGDTLKLYTNGLADANRFMSDYYTAMAALFPYATDYDFVNPVILEE